MSSRVSYRCVAYPAIYSLASPSASPEKVKRAYLVPQPLAGDDGHLITQLLVDLEVERQLGVVAFNDDLGGPLDGLGANATHVGELVVESSGVRRFPILVCRFSPSSLRARDFLYSPLLELT